MAESSSVFDADPTLLAPSQRLAQAHATLHNEMAINDEPSPSENVSVPKEISSSTGPGERHLNGTSREVNFSDESAFPSLGGTSSTKAKSLWGNTSRSVKPIVSTASQVVSSSDLVTEVLQLEGEQQQARSLGKSQTGTVVTAVQKATGTTIQMSTAQKTGTTTFLIKGRPDAVKAARKSLLKELGKKVSLKILVPSGVRPYIIGSKGRTLKAIIDKTGAKVQLPKRDENSIDVVDPEDMVEVTIEGDFEGASNARKEIEAIVSERTSSMSIKVTSIPSDFYGLLSLHRQQLENNQDLKIKIPSPSYTDNVPQGITISGEKSIVAETKDRLESMYEDFKRTTIPTSFPIAKKQHQFIATALPEILETTGCAVIIPPPSSTSDHITIRGPSANIGSAITMVMEKAQSMAIESLEVSRAHGSAPDQLEHAKSMTLYIRSSDRLKAMEKEHGVSISVPTGAELQTASKVIYDISGKSQSGVSDARKAMISFVNTLTPSKISRMQIDSLLYKKVMGLKSKNVLNVKKQHGVDVCFPDVEGSNVVLVYFGESTLDDEIRTSLKDAQASLEASVLAAGPIATEVIRVDAKYHGIVSGKNNTTLNAITGGSDSQVRVLMGQPDADSITIKGPKSEVIKVIKDIHEVVEQAETSEASEKANLFKLEFDFPALYTKNLIGKGGSNISRIREELGVRIDVGDEGRITCQGPQRNVEEAKSRITLLGEKLADETTFRLKIPAEFHGQIIGQGGKFVKRLEDKYQVQINFPRSGSDVEDIEDKPGKNEVTIKGGKKGATSAKSEIMELFEYENEHSFSATVEVLQRAIAQIVGKGGAAINDLKDETNTKIDIDREASADETTKAKVAITITGKKAEVETAKIAILKINAEVADTVTRTLLVDPAFHRNLIGAGGSNIRELVIKAGGPDDAAARARMVRFPRAGNDSNEIVLKGPQKVIEKIAKAIEKIVGTASSQHSMVTMVPKDQVKIIIGRGGSRKQELETKYSVTIDIPRAEAVGDADVPVKVLGLEGNVSQAIEEITNLVKVPESETVHVPRKFHRLVADNGAFIRRIKADYKVSIDHAGHELPRATKSITQAAPSTARIDDDEEANDAWSIVESTSDEIGNIPWVLRGDSNSLAKAKKAITAALAQASTQTHTGYLSVPVAKHRFIIGQGGSTIKVIRETTGTKIEVPRNQGGEVIVIKGSLSGLEQARTMILEATTTPSSRTRGP